MLEFIRRKKGKISQLLVYSIDRFSRTGGAAIKLATDLREQYGVKIFAITQPTDTTHSSGVLHQNIQLLFSEYDNQQRKEKIVAGMTGKLEKGIWVLKAPFGYDNVTINSQKMIVINEQGKKLKKAFQWKLQGVSNIEIIERLKTYDIDMYPQNLCRILANPFYCGLIVHGLLDGKVTQGVHERMITPEEFLLINEIRQASPQYGIKHENENDHVPLRRFIICDVCSTPFTGYVVKKKALHYYKCRTKACKCNVSAKTMNNMFAQALEHFVVKPEYHDMLLFSLIARFEDSMKADRENEKILKGQLTEIEKDIETIDKKYWVKGEMDKDKYEKFYVSFNEEKGKIVEKINASVVLISNLEEAVRIILKMCGNINEIWALSDVANKEILQRLIFPSGLVYDRQNRAFRTDTINDVFDAIASESLEVDETKRGLTPFFWNKSPLVVPLGLEPRTYGLENRCSIQLSYGTIFR